MVTLTLGALADILAGTSINDPYLQVTSLHSIHQLHSTITKYRVDLSDGTHTHSALLADKYNNLIIEEALVIGTIICVKKYSCKLVNNFMYAISFPLSLNISFSILLLSLLNCNLLFSQGNLS